MWLATMVAGILELVDLQEQLSPQGEGVYCPPQYGFFLIILSYGVVLLNTVMYLGGLLGMTD